MQKLIKDGALGNDSWTLLKEATGPEVLQAVPGKNFIVPLNFWTLYRQELADYEGNIAVWIDSHEDIANIVGELENFSLIALNFPVFSDGRAYSKARELREKHSFKGDLRAIGDVLRDQLYYMSRCGFNELSLRHDQEIETCLQAFNDFSTGYQATVAEPTPLFRRR